MAHAFLFLDVLGNWLARQTEDQRRSWRVAADCKSAAFGLSRFDPYLIHLTQTGEVRDPFGMKTCPHCVDPFTPKDPRQKFCSRRCAGQFHRQGKALSPAHRENVRAALTGRFKDKPNPQKGSAQHREAVGRATTTGRVLKSLLTASKRTQRKVLARLELGCSRCGWKEGICDIHHIRGRKIPDADQHSNLAYICPNCHRLVHEGKVKGEDLVPLTRSLPENWQEQYYG